MSNMADLAVICARCGHDKADHGAGCCTHYGVGIARVDPVCFCRDFVEYSAEKIARWNAKQAGKRSEAA